MCAMLGWFSAATDFGFALEAREAVRIKRHGRGQHLDGDLALEIRVGGAIHLAHAARAKGGKDHVRAEVRARGHVRSDK